MPMTFYADSEKTEMAPATDQAPEASTQEVAAAEATEQREDHGRDMVKWWTGWFLIASGTILFIASMLHH